MAKDYFWLNLRELPYFRAMLRAVEAHFYQDFALPHPILDVGCGDGHFASITFDQKLDVGIDPWAQPLQEARRRDCYHGLVRADGAFLPIPDGYFACAVSNSVLEHIPHIEAVLAETRRVLKPGAPFYFCVPNPDYLDQLSIPAILGKAGLKSAGQAYTRWFRRVTRVEHAVPPETWRSWLERAGFQLERHWNYFPPPAWHAMEWGHYFGAPTLLPHALTGRWLFVPQRWNLALTDRLVRPYTRPQPDEQGVFTFYTARAVEVRG